MPGRAAILAALSLAMATPAAAKPQPSGPWKLPSQAAAGAGAQQIDGIAARIEDDIITESEVRELGKFQLLVDGKAKPREEILQELEDQWIIRGEAKTSKFAQPSNEDIDRAYAGFVKQYGSEEEFQKEMQTAGLTENDVRRLLADQLYYARFLDYRFRPAAQVDDRQVAAYYHDEFAPALKAKGDPVPPLEAVQERIHEVLVQRAITERAEKWLDETRQQLRIEIPAGSRSQ